MLTRTMQILFKASRTLAKPAVFSRSFISQAPRSYSLPAASTYASGVTVSPAFARDNKEIIEKVKKISKNNLSCSKSMLVKPTFYNVMPALFSRSLFSQTSIRYRLPSPSPYPSGVTLSPAFVNDNKDKIEDAKKALKYNLNCSNFANFSVFFDPSFDFRKSSDEVANVDKLTSNVFSQIFPGMIYEYECIIAKNDDSLLNIFVQNTFLPALKSVMYTLEDFDVFIDALFDFKKSSGLIAEIDSVTRNVLSQQCPGLFEEYNVIVKKNDDGLLMGFLENKFLPALRSVFKALSDHYGFGPHLVETSDGVLHDDDYMDFVKSGTLVLDAGEDGHGPLPHIIAAFMMKELESQGQIKSALNLYKSLSLRSQSYYCPDRQNFVYYFYLLLDYPVLSGTYMFGNPASMSNHLLAHGDALKNFASICRMHSQDICKFAAKDWQDSQDKQSVSRGRVLGL